MDGGRREPVPRRVTDVHVDADILIWQLRGVSAATVRLADLRREHHRLWTGVMQRAEILFHLRRGEETAAGRLLSQFGSHPLGITEIELASELYRLWHPSHGTDVHDAILAATVMTHGGRLITQNLRHFPMPGLSVERGWNP